MPTSIIGAPEQPLRWKGMWRFNVEGVELYDARARLWAPELGTFLSVDRFRYHDRKSTLWAWSGQSPLRWRDPTGHMPEDRYAGMGQDEIAAANSGAGWGVGVIGSGLAILLSGDIAAAMPGLATALGLGAFALAATQVQSSDDVAGHMALAASLGGLKALPGSGPIDCRAASQASVIARGEGNLVELLPTAGEKWSCPGFVDT